MKEPRVFDCLVLSGGGAKGAYGAGVAKALHEFRKLKSIDTEQCFIGTSAGALNASVLASHDADTLISFWLALTTRKVLGVAFSTSPYARALWKAAFSRGQLFSIYSNSGLEALIKAHVSFEDVSAKGHTLIVAATNYTAAKLTTFFHSPVVEAFVKQDTGHPFGDKRLHGWQEITTEESLHQCLLASASIPVFFPPVKIGNEYFVDGGIGNHTPTREAAYFLRNIEETGVGKAGEVYCVGQDPPRDLLEGNHGTGPQSVLLRTLDVYHTVHTKPIVNGWYRINKEVRKQKEAIEAAKARIMALKLREAEHAEVISIVEEELGRIGGTTARGDFPFHLIEPSASLGDTLVFDHERIKRNIQDGFIDAVVCLHGAGKIDAPEKAELLGLRIFGTDK